MAEIRFGTDGWRAVIGEDFTYENVRRIADATGRVLAEDFPGGVVLVGYDTRFEAGAFAAAAAEVLATHGLTVRLSDRYLPTPALSWAADRSDACGAVMLTASHNPGKWLGFKIKTGDGGSAPPSITKRVEDALPAEAPTARGQYSMIDIVSGYLDALIDFVDADAIRGAGLKVVVDPLYGAGRYYLADVLRRMGVDVYEIHGEDNPGFAGVHPEPIPPHVDGARNEVRMQHRSAGFFTDGDADRIGACDEHGEFVNPHRIFALVLRHLVEDKGMSGTVVKTLSTSVLLDRLCKHLGLTCKTTSIGFKWIYEHMIAEDVLIGGEESGGIGIPVHVRERDGLLNALLLAEMMAQQGKSLSRLVADLFAITGPLEYGRVDLKVDMATRDAFLAAVPTLHPEKILDLPVLDVLRQDGIKFFLPDDAWLLLRPSGTEPLVRVYAEAPSAGVVDDLLAAGQRLVKDILVEA